MFLDGVGAVVETLELGRYPEAREGVLGPFSHGGYATFGEKLSIEGPRNAKKGRTGFRHI